MKSQTKQIGKYNSKRVLQLGNNNSAIRNIEELNSHGAYVIVADKCQPHNNRYKNLVDEVVQLDIDNLDEIINYAKLNNIDAITTGFSEKSYEIGRILNEGIGNTYFHTANQWQTFMNKGNFRKLCYKNNISTPKTFFIGTLTELTKERRNEIIYPVIVKPCDGSGGRGISICNNQHHLNNAIKKAEKISETASIIIEEFIEGKEVVFTYVIQNGICKLVASSDKYVYHNKDGLTVLPEIYIYPCLDHDLYIEKVNDRIVSMIKSEGLNNCTIFFQTIEKDNVFYFFEAGLRIEGTESYVITNKYTNQNSLEFCYDYLLKVKTNYNIELEDPKMHGHKTALLDIHLKKGFIKKIEGLSYLKDNEMILFVNTFKKCGNIVKGNLLDCIFAGIGIKAEDIDLLVEEICDIKKHIKVKGIFNQNLIENSFDERELLKRKYYKC